MAKSLKLDFYFIDELETYTQKVKDLPHELVVSGYVIDGKRVCLLDHSDLKKWLPPGGHVKTGESPIDALKREVLEETGTEVQIISNERFYSEKDMIFQVPPPRFVQYELIEEQGKLPHIHVNFVYFCKKISAGANIQTDEGTVKWFEMNELDNLERLYPHTRMNAFAAIRELGDIIPPSLVVENNRILVPIGGRCPYGCKYCYTKRHDVYFGEPNPKQTIKKLAETLKTLPSSENVTAQLGYDNDPFLDFETGLEYIFRMLWMPVHIGFSTKADISQEQAEKLAILRKIKNQQGYNLSGLVTLTCIREKSVDFLEPSAPSPFKRLKTIQHLSDCGIPVMVNFRPLLPELVIEEELEEVIMAGKEYGACGIVFGAFWSDPEGIVVSDIMNPVEFQKHAGTKRISWSPHGLNWYRSEDRSLIDKLSKFCSENEILSFESSAEAVKHLNSQIGNGVKPKN